LIKNPSTAKAPAPPAATAFRPVSAASASASAPTANPKKASCSDSALRWGRDPSAGCRDAREQSDPRADRDDHDDRRDRAALREHQSSAFDRVGENEREDAFLFFAGRDRDRGRDPRGRDHERSVDRADLAAHPTGDRAVVGTAEQVRDTLGHVELADAVTDGREERTDQQDHRRHADRGDARAQRPEPHGHREHGAAHGVVSSR
jgi:hypothetical protein